MINLWQGVDEEFFLGLFSYLKCKFNVKVGGLTSMQKNREVCIYHESVVALEGVHEVLRRIKNGSAPTREDYGKAFKEKNQESIKAITDFYKKLALLDDHERDAFRNFSYYYYFDPVINHYKIFLNQYRDSDGQIDFGQFFRLSKKESEEEAIFDTDRLFKFVESYQASLLVVQMQTNQTIKDRIEVQNSLYRSLMVAYNILVSRNMNFGVSVVDIQLPIYMENRDLRPESLSTRDLAKVIAHLKTKFSNDDAILLTVNHAHVISSHYFILSYLVIYKSSIYKNSNAVFELILKELQWIIGSICDRPFDVINREAMLKKLYPQEVFTGTLSSSKQKTAFRDKFLRYFLSSIFLMEVDKSEEMQFQEEFRNLALNSFIFYEEKLYQDSVRIESKALPKIPKQQQQKTTLKYLDELINESEWEKADKYFKNKGLPTEEIQKNQIIHFLYKQQGITNVSDSLIDDLIRVESFLSRLMYEFVYEYSGQHTRGSYEASPKLAKLSVLFQQFLLISMMRCVKDESRLPKELYTKAIYFSHQFRRSFGENYCIDETAILRRNLDEYKIKRLRLAAKQERQELKKGIKRVASIQDYLSKVIEKDVVVLRFVFKCGASDEQEATLFDDMFRDYVDNLKRRHTKEYRLEGHVGVYIPHRSEHYIDATLLFQISKKLDSSIKDLIDAVIDYWGNYVEYKQQQILTFNEKHYKKYSGNRINPFNYFKRKPLASRCLPVVKTENSLNYDYVEIRQGQQTIQQLLIDKISLYYAYCPLILVKPDEYDLLPRKNCLILGRMRESYSKKSTLGNSKTNWQKNENLNMESVSSEMVDQPTVVLSDQVGT